MDSFTSTTLGWWFLWPRYAAAVEDGSQYFILLIITDGVISDMAQTKEAIVNVSSASALAAHHWTLPHLLNFRWFCILFCSTAPWLFLNLRIMKWVVEQICGIMECFQLHLSSPTPQPSMLWWFVQCFTFTLRTSSGSAKMNLTLVNWFTLTKAYFFFFFLN